MTIQTLALWLILERSANRGQDSAEWVHVAPREVHWEDWFEASDLSEDLDPREGRDAPGKWVGRYLLGRAGFAF